MLPYGRYMQFLFLFCLYIKCADIMLAHYTAHHITSLRNLYLLWKSQDATGCSHVTHQIDYALPYSVDFKAPGEYLVNVALFGINDL